MKNSIASALDNQSTVPSTPEAADPAVTSEEVFSSTATETTGELDTEQASTAPATNVPGFLPKNYLALGYHATTDKGAKYLRPEFVGQYAETMANLLADMKPSDFNALLREMKRNRKRSLPYEARLTAAAEMLPKALFLVCHKKAPALLVSFIKDNLDHIHDDDDWMAFYRHLEAIAGFMTVQKGGDA